jgi:hypothetical protein
MPKFARSLAIASLLACAAAISGTANAQAFSDYLENKLVDHLLRGQTLASPTNVYVGLSTSACNDTSVGTEVTGGSYARVTVASSLANWAGTQSTGSTSASSGTGGSTAPPPTTPPSLSRLPRQGGAPSPTGFWPTPPAAATSCSARRCPPPRPSVPATPSAFPSRRSPSRCSKRQGHAA